MYSSLLLAPTSVLFFLRSGSETKTDILKPSISLPCRDSADCASLYVQIRQPELNQALWPEELTGDANWM